MIMNEFIISPFEETDKPPIPIMQSTNPEINSKQRVGKKNVRLY